MFHGQGIAVTLKWHGVVRVATCCHLKLCWLGSLGRSPQLHAWVGPYNPSQLKAFNFRLNQGTSAFGTGEGVKATPK